MHPRLPAVSIPRWAALLILIAAALACNLPGGAATDSAAPPDDTSTGEPGRAPTEHRIGVRVVDGVGEFYDRQTAEKFVPRGANYVRLDLNTAPCAKTGAIYHSVFNVDRFDADRTAQVFTGMAGYGYNTVRVFLNAECLTDQGGSLQDDYLDNVTSFVRLAAEHELYVIITTDFPPGYGYAYTAPPAENIEDVNVLFLSPGGLVVERRFWQDFIKALIDRQAPVDRILAYALRNELSFEAKFPPLSLSSGKVTTGNGQTYDMSLPGDRQRMMDENLVAWIDEARAAILEVDPTALVTVGFFQPQEPNPTRIGDTRLISTYPAIWQSSADFIDLHLYPGGDLTLSQYVENYRIEGMQEKPILMGEFGAFRDVYSTPGDAARALQRWQAESCEYGFDGWLLWTWDTAEQGEIYNGVEGDGAINQALAPATRSDPCAVASGVTNLALRKTVTASQSLAQERPEMAIDGLAATEWGAGADPPQWIEIDLGAPLTIAKIRMLVGQYPNGPTVHRVVGRSPAGLTQVFAELSKETRDGDWLEIASDAPWENIQFIRVETVSGPSWVAWREIEIFGPVGE